MSSCQNFDIVTKIFVLPKFYKVENGIKVNSFEDNRKKKELLRRCCQETGPHCSTPRWTVKQHSPVAVGKLMDLCGLYVYVTWDACHV